MKIALYITGSISCYKSIEICRLLVKKNHQVVVILSKGAERFLRKELFSYIGANEVYGFDDDWSCPSKSIRHIELSRWCDIFVVCPASANTITHLANGFTKDLGTTVFLALHETTKIMIFPAMNSNMLKNKSVTRAFDTLGEHPNIFIAPTEFGNLACGESGLGKLLQVEVIDNLISYWPLLSRNKKVLISTGASVSPLDDVRYLTNPSSGKTGLLLAQSFLSAGYQVTVIVGFYNQEIFKFLKFHPNLTLEVAKTTCNFRDLTKVHIESSDIFISSAAISDISFKYVSGKIKKKNLSDTLEISSSPDVLKEVLKTKNKNQFFIGFAAESTLTKKDLHEKWKSKSVDLLVGTEVNNGLSGDEDTKGFISNSASYKFFENQEVSFSGKLNKIELSQRLLDKVNQWLN